MSDTATAVELGDLDTVPDFTVSGDDTASATPLCAEPGCLNHVIKPARGRTPKYCPEHQSQRSSSTPKQTSGGRWSKADSVRSSLNTLVNGAGLGLQAFPALAADGQTLILTSPQIIDALIQLGREDKRVRLWLERLAAPGKYGPLVMASLPLLVGILANHNLLPQFVVDLTPGSPNATSAPAGGEQTL